MEKIIESLKARQNSVEVLYPSVFDANTAYDQFRKDIHNQSRIICEVASTQITASLHSEGVKITLNNIGYVDAGIAVYHAKNQNELLKVFGIISAQRDKHVTILYSPDNQNGGFNRICKDARDLYNGFYKTAGCDLTKGQILSHSLSFAMPPLCPNSAVIKIAVNNMESLPESMFLQTELNEVIKSIILPNMCELAKIKAIERWIKQKFMYVTTKRQSDHKSFSTYLNGHGVCNGIAGIAQYMLETAGLSARYITGMEVKTRVGHAWNMVKYDGKWYHIDFTNSPPSWLLSFTNPLIENEQRKRSYAWEVAFFSDAQNDLSISMKSTLKRHELILIPNSNTCMIDMVNIDFYSFSPLLVRNSSTYISLSYLLVLLGIPFEREEGTLLVSFPRQSRKFKINNRFGGNEMSVVKYGGNYYLNIRYLMEIFSCNLSEFRGLISVSI